MSDVQAFFFNPFPNPTENDWRARVDAVLKGGDFAKKLVSHTHDGITLQPLYARRYEAPLVTGSNPGKPWRVMCRVDHPDADAAAAQAREDLEGGADALALVMPDSRSARGHGITCESLSDLEASLAGVHLDLIRLRIDPAPGGRIHALMIAALVEKRKLNPVQVEIDFGMDPIASLSLLGKVPWDWASMAGRLAETVLALKARGFKGPFLTVDVRPCHEAGASEGQELAAALAQGVLYLRALEAHGLALEDAFGAISFILPIDGDQFLGIAKLRAFRKLWAKVAETCAVSPAPAFIHAETSWRMLTRRDSHVNILRNSIATFAAGIGGADTVTVLPFTQALGLPDTAARRLARNTSIVLMEEASLWRVADPAAGAGAYEALTDELAGKAWALFQEIEAEGGLIASLTLGGLQNRIKATAAARAKAIATRKEPITGTSEFADLAENPPAVLNITPVGQTLPKARAKAKLGSDSGSIIDAMLDGASRADAAPVATGEICAEPLLSHRSAEPFETLRDRADAILAKTGKRPRVTLMTLGALADHATRLQFTRNLFEAGGIEITDGSDLVCLVGSDAAYAGEGATAASNATAAGTTVWLAGRPGELESLLREAGVKRFVFAGCDVLECLNEALELVR
jgi:methylmalonyl-CoA mutase